MSNKRHIENAIKFKLWVDSSGFCPKCNLNLFVFDFDKIDESNVPNKIANHKNDDKKQVGEIAHIISLNSLTHSANKHPLLNKKKLDLMT